jgi:hypothetical protein
MNPSEHPMQIQTEKQRLLADVLPAFATELQQPLNEQGEPGLAAKVRTLVVFDRCRCGDDVCCGTFHTLPKPNGRRACIRTLRRKS